MKKYIAMLVTFLVAGAVFAQVQETTITYTNASGDVFTDVVVGYVGTGVAASVPAAGTTVVGTAAPSSTPTQLGQVAVDVTDDVPYLAVGTTSSDWSPVIPFTVLSSTTLGADYNLTNRAPLCIGESVYAVSNVLSAATGAGTTGTIACAIGATVNDWVIIK